jgi:hypothetical protein
MPPCAIHHNDDASNTISNSSAQNGKAIALAQRNCACPRNSARDAFAADRMSGSFVSIPTTERGFSAYRNVNRPSPAPTSRRCALRKSTAWRIALGSTPAGSTSIAIDRNDTTRPPDEYRVCGYCTLRVTPSWLTALPICNTTGTGPRTQPVRQLQLESQR